MIKEMLPIAVVALGLLLIPGLNSEANAIHQQPNFTSETSHKHPTNFHTFQRIPHIPKIHVIGLLPAAILTDIALHLAAAGFSGFPFMHFHGFP